MGVSSVLQKMGTDERIVLPLMSSLYAAHPGHEEFVWLTRGDRVAFTLIRPDPKWSHLTTYWLQPHRQK